MLVRYKAQTPAQTLPDVYKITQPVSFKDINLNAQLKLCTKYKMETWFWILGWILYILTIAGEMVSPYFLWAFGVCFAAKPTRSSFHLQWRISVLGRSLFLHCSSVTSEVAAFGLKPIRHGWILEGGSLRTPLQ